MTTEGLRTENYFTYTNSKLEKLLAVFGFLLVSIILSFSLIINNKAFFSSAEAPKSLAISNVTDSSFTVSWKTSKRAGGYVIYGASPENLNLTAYDNKAPDDSLDKIKLTDHAVTLTNLKGNTYYYYKIVSGREAVDGVGGKIFAPVKTSLVSPFTKLPFQSDLNK